MELNFEKDNWLEIIGKYGEKFLVSKIKDNSYIVSCHEIDIDDLVLDKQSLEALIKLYVDVGIPPCIAKEDKGGLDTQLFIRAVNLGHKLYDIFEKFLIGKSESYLRQIKDIISRADRLHLNDIDFIDLFITAGSTPNDILKDKSGKAENYFYSFIKQFLTKSQIDYLEKEYESEYHKKSKSNISEFAV